MINFTKPLTGELLYSVIARARVHFCVVSPKRLIAKTMGTRSVVSSLMFPSHLGAFFNCNALSLPSPNTLIFRHTLFPLYAPFIPEHRRMDCLQRMNEKTFGAVHLSTGYACSRLPKLQVLRCCPVCYRVDIENCGEPFWHRIHQVVGLDNCVIHSALLITMHPYHAMQKRHEYIPLSILNPPSVDPRVYPLTEAFQWLNHQIIELLDKPQQPSQDYSSWSIKYKQLLRRNGFLKGEHVNYELLKSAVLDAWPNNWLKSVNLLPTDSQSCWLHGISRKHRKSFSYLEHLVLLYSVEGKQSSITNFINQATVEADVKTETSKTTTPYYIQIQLRSKQKQWLALIKKWGTKLARKNGGAAIYAWLYRNNKDWLLRLNQRYKRPIIYKNKRVNWHLRDINTVRKLFKSLYLFECNPPSMRQSKKWFLSRLQNGTSIEKYLPKLPLTTLFLERYSESIDEYQIRRLTNVYSTYKMIKLPRWKLIRFAGLSDTRMTELTQRFLAFLITRKPR